MSHKSLGGPGHIHLLIVSAYLEDLGDKHVMLMSTYSVYETAL